MVPAWLVENQLNNLLEKQKIVYKSLSVSGYLVNGFWQKGEFFSDIYGFWVESSFWTIDNTKILPGDVILKIDGRDILDQDIARQVLSLSDQFDVEVLRDGKKIDLTLEKQEIL